jgi:Tfp pilus assembly protein PilF
VGYVIARTWAQIALGDLNEARRNVDAVLKVARISDALLQDGVLKFAARDITGARASLEEVLKSNPEDTRALSVLAQTYTAQKQAPAAMEKIRNYAQQRPKSGRLQMFWANWLLENGKKLEARAALTAAKAADTKLPAADIALARLDFAEGNLAAARQRLTALVSANRQDVEANLVLAGVEEASGNYSAAIDHYLQTLEADERNVAALNNLAYDLSRDGARLEDALRYALKARALAPDSSYAQDTLGWIYYRKGLYQFAAKELEGALAKESRPSIQFHLGLTYKRLGNSEKGSQLLATALATRPDLVKTEPIP